MQALTASEKSSKNFSLAGLRNKRLNSRNDITDDFIQDPSMIKTLTAHGIENFQGKYDLNKINAERGAFVVECIKEYIKQMQDQRTHPEVKDWQLYRDQNTLSNLQTWLSDNDQVLQFLAERAYSKEETKPTDRRPVDNTYNSYVSWTKEAGTSPLSKRKFNKQMKEKGFKMEKNHLEI